MTDLEQLAGRVEAAVGADRELDADIRLSVLGDCAYGVITGNRYQIVGFGTLQGYVSAYRDVLTADDALDENVVPRYTSSLDAAMTLVPEGWSWKLTSDGAAQLFPNVEGGWLMSRVNAYSSAPALAICAAALRAHPRSQGGA